MEDSSTAWAYELDDGAPVNFSLHGIDNQQAAAGGAGAPAGRVPFGDVTLNFAEYYAAYLDNTTDLKSPDRNGRRLCTSRFSPNRPPGSGAAKKLVWNNSLPPLPRPSQTPANEQAAVGIEPPVTGDASPTRHTLRAEPAVASRGPTPVTAPVSHPAAQPDGLADSLDLLRSIRIGDPASSKRLSLAQKSLFTPVLSAQAPSAACLGAEQIDPAAPGISRGTVNGFGAGRSAPGPDAGAMAEADENAVSTGAGGRAPLAAITGVVSAVTTAAF